MATIPPTSNDFANSTHGTSEHDVPVHSEIASARPGDDLASALLLWAYLRPHKRALFAIAVASAASAVAEAVAAAMLAAIVRAFSAGTPSDDHRTQAIRALSGVGAGASVMIVSLAAS